MLLLHRVNLLIILLISGPSLWSSNFDDATGFIREWVKTEQLIGEESTDWNAEKAALADVKDALEKEIEELEIPNLWSKLDSFYQWEESDDQISEIISIISSTEEMTEEDQSSEGC